MRSLLKLWFLSAVLCVSSSASIEEPPLVPNAIELPVSLENGTGAKDPLYVTVEQVFNAYHNKLMGALFGKALFADFIYPATLAQVRDEIRSLDDTSFSGYIAPLPMGISQIFLSVWLSFFVLAMSYTVIVNVKYYLERAYVKAKERHNQGGKQSPGGQGYLLRVIVSGMFLIPMAPYLIDVLLDKEEQDPPLFVSSLFGVLGQTFEHTERISRVFNKSTDIESPHYYIPSDDALSEQFKKMTMYAKCVASIQATGKKEVHSKLSWLETAHSSLVGSFLYESNYRGESVENGGCSLKVSLDSSLSSGFFGGDTKSIRGALEHETTLVKSALDAYLTESLTLSHEIADVYYEALREDAPANFPNSDLNADWLQTCDAVRERALSPIDDDLEQATSDYLHLPYCFSADYVEVFAYPISGELNADDLRYNFVCSNVSGLEVWRDSEAYLEECVRVNCDINNLDGKGFAQCAVAKSSHSTVKQFKSLTNSKGFFFAPAYKMSPAESFDVIDDFKRPINTFKVKYESSFEPLVSGTPVFSKEYERPQKLPQITFDHGFAPTIKKPNAVSDAKVVFETTFGRFSSCVTNSNEVVDVYGMCMGAYEEMQRMAKDTANFLVTGLVAYYAEKALPKFANGKSVKGSESSKSSVFDLPLMEKLLNKLKTLNILTGALSHWFGHDFWEVMDFSSTTNAGDMDYFEPNRLIIDDTMGHALFSGLGSLLEGGLVGTLMILFLMIMVLLILVLVLYPLIAFLAAITHALINLFAFVSSMPFQISDVLSDTGDEATRHLKTVLVKWVLVLFRFPVVVGGFYLSYIIFNALIQVIPWDTLFGTDMFDGTGTLNEVSQIYYWVGSLFYIFCLCYLVLMASFGTAGVAYSIVREYSGADASGVDDDDLQDAQEMRKAMGLEMKDEK